MNLKLDRQDEYSDMLPPQHATQDLQRMLPAVERYIDGGFLGGSLLADDVLLIGSYVRSFTFIELNLHRAVRMFRELGALSAKEARRPASCDLASLVDKGVVNTISISAELDELKGYLAEISVGQPFRNLLAHWACSRLPNSDVFIFLTMEERDARAIGNHSPSHDGVYFALVRQGDLRALLRRMEVAGQWLAERVARWHLKLFTTE